MRRIGEVSSFQNVAAGAKATIDLPADRRYHALHLNYKTDANRATIEADIKLIKVYLNGIPQWEITAKELLAIYERHGHTFTAGMLPLYFSEPWRRTTQGEDSTALATLGRFRTFQIEVEFDAAAAAPTLECFAEYDFADINPNEIRAMRKFVRQQVPVAAVGPHTLTNIPNNGSLHGLHCFENAVDDITSVRVKVNDAVIYDIPRVVADTILKDQGGAPVAGVFHIAFDRTERVGHMVNQAIMQNGVPVLSQFSAEFQMANASPFFMLYEFVGPANSGG